MMSEKGLYFASILKSAVTLNLNIPVVVHSTLLCKNGIRIILF